MREKDENMLGRMTIQSNVCDGLPVGSTPRLESAADGRYANWCQINGHTALEQFSPLPHCSSPAMSTHCGPHVAASPLPAVEPDPA